MEGRTLAGRAAVRRMRNLILSLAAVLSTSAIPFVLSARGGDELLKYKDGNIDINRIVQESARITEADRKASAGYDYSETDLEGDGVRKTYAVHMLGGSPYRELIAIDGKPLPQEKEAEEKRKLAAEMTRRRRESASQRADRIAEYEKESARDRRFIAEFVNAFTFKLESEQEMDHREVYVVDAIPRPDFRPTDRESIVLTGMRGTLYIDKKTGQWVKAEAQVTHPVSIVGFLATVNPGTRFVLEKMPVDGGVWLARHFTMTARANILSFIPHHKHEDVSFFDYHKAAQPPS